MLLGDTTQRQHLSAYIQNTVIDEALDEQRFTLLHRIILGLHGMKLDTVLHESICEVNAADAYGRRPLMWAAWRGDTSRVKQLLDAGAGVNSSCHEQVIALGKAARLGHLDCVRILLRAGTSLPIANIYHRQPIHFACHSDTHGLPIMTELVRIGADLGSGDTYGWTPLHHAAGYEELESVSSLISLGANIDARDDSSVTPALTALISGQELTFV